MISVQVVFGVGAIIFFGALAFDLRRKGQRWKLCALAAVLNAIALAVYAVGHHLGRL